ncbi:hypothetical protein SDC9_209471 [bioreactor metagenome]|uniref:Uncharacterized protein n=1 Tax=bioreactor metagenome TaxID=1076179 RepID=A0A645JGD1_9ZZZZ
MTEVTVTRKDDTGRYEARVGGELADYLDLLYKGHGRRDQEQVEQD